MNSGNKRKDIVFAISAGAGYGMGHLMRCSVLAREAKRQGMNIGFLLKGDDAAYNILKRDVPGAEIMAWNDKNFSSCSARLVAFDTKIDIDKECALVSDMAAKIVLLDRLLPDTEAVDLYILPVAHGSIPSSEVGKRILSGPDYIVLSEVFTDKNLEQTDPEKRDILMISLGGSDPFKVTSRVMDACYLLKDALYRKHIKHTVVVLGPANQQTKYLEEEAVGYDMEVLKAPDQNLYGDYLMRSFLVIIGFGIAVYEIAYLGLPGLFITHHKEDIDCAKRLELMGLGWFLGYGPELSVDFMANKFTSILSQPNLLERKPELFLDGKGGARIIARFVQMIEGNYAGC